MYVSSTRQESSVGFILARQRLDLIKLPYYGGKVLNPPVYSSMINTEASLDPYLFQIAVAQRVAEIPADTQQDERCLKVAILEELGLRLSLHERGSGC